MTTCFKLSVTVADFGYIHFAFCLYYLSIKKATHPDKGRSEWNAIGKA